MSMRLLFKINWLKFIYLNFFCKKIKRKKNKYLIPYFRTIIKINKDSCVVVNNNVHFGINSFLSSSKSILNVFSGSSVVFNGYVRIKRGVCIETRKQGVLQFDDASINENCLIVCEKSIRFGKGLLMSRDCIIRDCDGHTIKKAKGFNKPQPINIGENVWICQRSTILKGVSVGDNSVIAANATITKNLSNNCVCYSKETIVEAPIEGWVY